MAILVCIIPLWPHRRHADTETVHWASDSLTPAVQNVDVNHGCRDIVVPQKLLHGPDIVAIFKYIRGTAFKSFDSFEPFDSLSPVTSQQR